ncbi:MAG: hypothetical protein FWH32_02475 [Clostridiales bacterium]|nr:hypothetical protein [Clostridiales bacterium]
MKMFNKAFYLDRLKYLRWMGIVCTVIAWSISLIAVFSTLSYYQWVPLSTGPEFKGILSASTMILSPIVYAMGFFMVFLAYSFQYRRNASDYYHSLSLTRTQLYFSTGAAVLTWIFFVVISTVLLVNVVASAIADSVGMSLSDATGASADIMLIFMLHAFIMVGAAMLATSLTGTAFSSFVTAVLLYALPWVIASFMQSVISDIVVILPESPSYMPAYSSMVFSAFVEDFDAWKKLIAPVLLAIAYIIVGWLCAKKRPSETAGKSSPNKALQTFIRSIVAFPFLLLAVSAFNDKSVSASGDISYDIWSFARYIVLSVMFYILYEIISTRNVKSLPKAIPYYAVPLGAALALWLMASAVGTHIISFQPPAHDIEYVRIERFTENRYRDVGNTYMTMKLSQIEFHEQQMKELVLYRLEKSREEAKAGTFYSNPDKDEIYCTVELNMRDGSSHTRVISLMLSDISNLEIIINAGNHAELRELPLDSEISSLEIGAVSSWGGIDGVVTGAQAWEIWEMYKEELSRLSATNFNAAVGAGYASRQIEASARIVVAVEESDGSQSRHSFPLTQFTFRALDRYVEIADPAKQNR